MVGAHNRPCDSLTVRNLATGDNACRQDVSCPPAAAEQPQKNNDKDSEREGKYDSVGVGMGAWDRKRVSRATKPT